MPSNADLIKAIAELSAEREVDMPETEGLKNDELADLVSELRKQEPEPAPKPKPAAKKPPFYVAPGKAITCRKGILSGDTQDEVKADYLSGGSNALQGMVDAGLVLKG